MRRHVLLACLADGQLLREPLPPVSELFPEHAPKPPRRIEPRSGPCPACNGTGRELARRSPYDDGWSYDSHLPTGWRRRIEALEECVFGSADDPFDAGTTAVVPSSSWPEW